jgi:hypothetical protein
VPHRQAGHMTAPDQCCIDVKRLLSIRRRPHMTLSGQTAAQRLLLHEHSPWRGACSLFRRRDHECDPGIPAVGPVVMGEVVKRHKF